MTSSTGLSSSYLRGLCRKLLPTFSDVVSCDNMNIAFPDFRITRSAIVNAAQQSVSHGHWLAIQYNSKLKKFIFWDPLGFDVSMYPIIANFLLKTKKQIENWQLKIQHSLSTHCGFHCLAFLLHLDFGIDTKSFFDLFDRRDLLFNDDVTTHFIIDCIKTIRLSHSRDVNE